MTKWFVKFVKLLLLIQSTSYMLNVVIIVFYMFIDSQW